MRELSLFTGAGGGVLGSLLLGWETVGYVEWDDYCQRVIRQRIDDGILHEAPIFGDVRAFLSDGYAGAYQGMVDVVSAGFPCQPFSVAGQRAGADDDRNMWPATIGVIRAVRPRYCFLENVPGLFNSGYFDTILGDLAESGYDARWRVLSAAELGAPHRRDRLWIIAYATGKQNRRGQFSGLAPDAGAGGEVADAAGQRRTKPGSAGKAILEHGEIERSAGCGSGSGQWWTAEPDVGRVAHGVASRVDRLKAIGNGQVPAVAAAAWRLLTEGE